jgi:hypothetical protein
MSLITNKYDQLLIQSGTKGKSKSDDVAFSADGTSHKGKQHSQKSKFPYNCNNCGWKGHKKEDCWEEGGGKAGKAPKGYKLQGKKSKSKDDNKVKASGSNTDASKSKDDSKPDGVWLVSAEDIREEVPESRDTPLTAPDSAKLTRHHLNTQGTTVDLYDSGASQHMSLYQERFINFKSIPPHAIEAADKRTFDAIGRGDLPIKIPNGKHKTRILLTNVLYAPSMGATLVSISRLTRAGFAALFRGDTCRILDAKNKTLGKVTVSRGLYRIQNEPTPQASAASTLKVMTMAELHQQMAHVAPSAIREMLVKGMIEGVKLDPSHATMDQCESCKYAKATRKPIGKERDLRRCENLGDEVHTDLWGPSQVQTPSGKTYYVSFTDDHTRYTCLYLLALKSDTFESHKTYEAWLKTQYKVQVKRLRSDCGGEYLSDEFTQYLRAQGTIRKLTTHDTPQHNDIAERLNRTLAECVCAVMHVSGLPKNLWGEGIKHVVYVKNRSIMRSLEGKTPYEMLMGKKPHLGDLPICSTKVWVHDPTGPKLDMCARVGRWISFDAESGAHRIYFKDRRNIAVECNVMFARQREEGPALRPNPPIEKESETTKSNQQVLNVPAPVNTHQNPTSSTNSAPPNDPLGPNFEQQPHGPR